ncbi:hypothetical protein [uncultured Bacteroides sp.]|uniref:hypothetical protein n=1 Tax=uncultured Bacteroides sp. TaxID=162156 RepID=UPI002AAA87AB|nr:hypothetical protein [uncultured Bacteroides sp.]
MAKPSKAKLNHSQKTHEVQPSEAKAIPNHQTPPKQKKTKTARSAAEQSKGNPQPPNTTKAEKPKDRPHIRSVKRSERVER